MCALAHVLEREGIATVTLVTKARFFPEQMRPPRALFCDFPLGRPLGRPRDPDFQRAVLLAALDLLSAEGPVLRDFPETIDDEIDSPMSCMIPPLAEAGLAPSVGEARGLRAAFERGGGQGISSAIDPQFAEASLEAFERVAGGVPWRDAGFPNSPQRCALAVRGFYEQAAIGLTGAAGGARAAESWFAEHTLAGATLSAAREAMRTQGEAATVWNFVISAAQAER
ncbi:MAG: hypothetical protein ABIQ73_13565 [Acidimicrobiales bacterium]